MTTASARSLTKAASKQAYLTIRLLVDHASAEDAFRSYAYFRWIDDVLDGDSCSAAERRSFLERQRSLLGDCYRGVAPRTRAAQEEWLVQLVRNDPAPDSGLQFYLWTMMLVMDFDLARRGRLISHDQLNRYTRWLAMAVTENIHHFIGHGQPCPISESRYMAVAAAHVTHMLRDTFDDIQAGYYNVPRELLEANRIGPHDVHSDPYRTWAAERVALARRYFRAGKNHLSHVRCFRLRLVVLAYAARFEWLLDTIEQDDFRLRPAYQQRRSAGTALRMASLMLGSMIRRSEQAGQRALIHGFPASDS